MVPGFVFKYECSSLILLSGVRCWRGNGVQFLIIRSPSLFFPWGFPGSSVGKYTCNAGDPHLIPGSGRSPGEWIGYPLQCSWTSLVTQTAKILTEMWETWVRSLGWEDTLEGAMATYSSILAWRIPMDRGAWRATVHGVAIRHKWATKHT